MPAKSTTTQAKPLKIERVFDASPERLWSYWTDPIKYAKWLNPAPIDLVIHEFDVRVGGRVRFDMPQPDGNKNPQDGVFHVLRPYAEIVTGDADKSFLIRVTFKPEGKKTRMTVEVTGLSPDWHTPATEGWTKGLDKLEKQLAAKPEGFTIERTFKAAPEKVWRMWTTKEGIEKWWAVSAKAMGYDMKVQKMDVRVGGKFAFALVGNGHSLINGGTYRVVDPPRELSWTWHFDIFLQPHEKPYDVPISVRLQPVKGGTRMTFTQGPLASAEHTEGSRQGVLQNLEQLAKALGE
jgi:uncharacterized protein YndB with AHSA1/START domain